MQNCSIGQVVYSKMGRDQGKVFVVVEIDEEYVYLADGKLRKIENPKKKKIKHIQITNNILGNLREKITKGMKVSNADIRKSLKPFEVMKENQELN
ncbi:MAG: RNA-binding protein [Epulopiscium sp.]|nr:RNA-binding protein [Candidatus Epulonipiscium sp.]